MAGWISSTGSGVGNGTGRGAGGRGFPNRRYNSDTIQGGSGSGSGRWRGERSRGRQPPQPQYQYRPVDTANRQSSTSAGTEQETSSTSTRHAQMTHPAAVTNKSPSLVETVAPASSNKETDDSGSPSAANFECNVCFDMAQEPVVTKCGHLFCWECLYQWLHVHSQARECPVCKGEVAEDAIIPIYGRGGSGASMKNAPPRPTGARVESSRQQLHTLPQDMVYVEDDDEEHNPFDFPNMVDFGFGGGPSIREAMRSFMSPSFHDVDIDDQYDDYSYELNPEDFVYDYGLMGFPVFPSAGTEAGNPSSSHMHADIMDLTDSAIPVHYGEFSYSGAPQSRNRGRHGRRHRARASADQSSTDAMVTGASSNFHCDNSANSNGSVGASSRPNTGWVERRGRSNRNSNSAGGRGMYDGR
ncbi:hypothetical protein QOZ80_2AG0118630 [Eleusine coracana subsp. coracana]|nr:hypothetical protein QOZ80_2AG0118630 [Eleusine coracana subsp. coracana]